MIFLNKKYYQINVQNKYFMIVKGNAWNDYDLVKESFNLESIKKYIKDNKIKIIATLDR